MRKAFFSDEKINSNIKIFLETTLGNYGINNYAYAIMNKRDTSQIVILTTYEGEWLDTYLEQKCQDIDPVVITAMNKVSPFSWDENLSIGNWKLPKVFEIAERYSVFRGYTFVLHDYNYNLVTLTLMLDTLVDSQIESSIKKNQGDIQLLLSNTHEALLTAYRKNKQDITPSISKRQMDILYLCQNGKTYPEIATILGITVSTVKFHMGDLVKRMGVKNAKHAISLSIELNLTKDYNFSGR